MKILILGANGLLGQALTNSYQTADQADSEHTITALNRAELDVMDTATLLMQIQNHAPDLIINCTAAARVDGCESEYAQAWAVNAAAPGLMAACAQEIGAAIMHISTDYVFDGEKRQPYTIDDAPRPISAYGRTKLGGEMAVKAATDRHYIVRVARLFGLRGSNFGSRIFDHLAQAQTNGKKLKVFTYPLSQATYLPDLVARLKEIVARQVYGIYQVTNDGPILSWFDFSRIAAEMADIDPAIIETGSYQEMNLPAARPYYSALRCLLSEQIGLPPLPDWQQGLRQLYQDWLAKQGK